MKYKDWYEQYAKDLESSTTMTDKYTHLSLLKRVLVGARLYNQDTTIDRDPTGIRRRLRPYIIKEFDEREILIQMINEYFAYFSQDWNPDGSAERILRPDDLYDSTEWKVKLLKYLQSGEDTDKALKREDIAEHFGVSKNALDNHLKELMDGTEVLGRQVDIYLRYGKNTYGSTIHPVFMALNLSEVYFLSAVLPYLAKGTAYEETALTLASDVYHQLTPYAKGIIDPHCKALAVEHDEIEKVYRPETYDDFLFFEKSGKKCRIIYADHPEPLIGRVTHGEYNFETEDGTKYQLKTNMILEIREV